MTGKDPAGNPFYHLDHRSLTRAGGGRFVIPVPISSKEGKMGIDLLNLAFPALGYSKLVQAIHDAKGSWPEHFFVIGVTDNPGRRWGEHGRPQSWLQWRTKTETDARNAERAFLSRGMSGGDGGGGNAAWLYLFRNDPVRQSLIEMLSGTYRCWNRASSGQ